MILPADLDLSKPDEELVEDLVAVGFERDTAERRVRLLRSGRPIR